MDAAGLGTARQGKAGQGRVSRLAARDTAAGLGNLAGQGPARPGRARRGAAWQGWARQGLFPVVRVTSSAGFSKGRSLHPRRRRR